MNNMAKALFLGASNNHTEILTDDYNDNLYVIIN